MSGSRRGQRRDHHAKGSSEHFAHIVVRCVEPPKDAAAVLAAAEKWAGNGVDTWLELRCNYLDPQASSLVAVSKEVAS